MGLAPFTGIISAILLLCLALDGCQGQVNAVFNAKEALALARKAALGPLGADVKIFNVLEYGAKADGTTNNAFGPTVWQKPGIRSTANPGGRRPSSLKFNNVKNAIIRGLTSIDAKGFHVFISNSENFRIFNIDIQAPDTSPNTDGIHMSKSSIVKISKTKIGTGDDCVSMIHGCTNISIKKVVCGPGHGLSIGSLGHYEGEIDVKGIIVKNCSMINTDNGLRIKSYMSNFPSKASNIVFQDIIMTRVQRPIIINQEYDNINGAKSSKVSVSDVFFTNVRGTTVTKTAVSLICSQSNPCTNIHLNNVDLKYEGKIDDKLYMSSCTNVKPSYGGVQNPPPCPI
ncbi:Glycoside hydrolase, family 28 [Corchorus olitorius]|uniref:Glycoside hydrolase, family 28 n=1 Tax=Corchorus olitorius TaxID=93759 RepID=A0A1R3HTG5_9ROSI|nr:Glycoside hydrolase, family 28 [Corchorus olitorius]